MDIYISVHIGSNLIGSEGMSYMATALIEHPSLEKLYLGKYILLMGYL